MIPLLLLKTKVCYNSYTPTTFLIDPKHALGNVYAFGLWTIVHDRSFVGRLGDLCRANNSICSMTNLDELEPLVNCKVLVDYVVFVPSADFAGELAKYLGLIPR